MQTGETASAATFLKTSVSTVTKECWWATELLSWSTYDFSAGHQSRESACLVCGVCVRASKRKRRRQAVKKYCFKPYVFVLLCNDFLAIFWATLWKASLNNLYTAYILLFRTISDRGQNISNQNRKRHKNFSFWNNFEQY
jgi:hypothetical protein